MSTDVDTDALPFVEGALAGFGAWVVGYLLTYIVAGSGMRESGLNRLIEAFEGEPATYELVGWAFYNAHFVDIVYEGFGSAFLPASYVGGEEGVTALLFVVPPALLVAAGLAVCRSQGVTDHNRGAVVGLTVIPGYVVCALVGVFLFEVAAGGTTGRPDPPSALLLAGIVYPLVFACAGGAVAGLTADRTPDDAGTVERPHS